MMKCRKVKLLLAPYILGDLTDDLKLVCQLEAHLRNCDYCAEKYQHTRQTISFTEEYKDIFIEVFAEIDMERERKEDAQKQKNKSIHLFLRIGVAAACLVIGIFTWMVLNSSKSQTLTKNSSQQVVIPPKPDLYKISEARIVSYIEKHKADEKMIAEYQIGQ